MYQYILFDLDGTLTDSKPGITKCVQYALKSFGIDEPDLDKLTPFVGPPLDESFMEFYGFDKEKAGLAIKKYRERFSTVGLYENSVLPGITDMLKALKSSGRTLAVATSKPYVFSKKILDKFDLSQYFDVIVGSELDGTRGSKAEVIEETLRQLGLNEDTKSSAIMVGDRKYDITGAKKCGIASIGVDFGYAEEGELKAAGADYICETSEELTALILKI